NAQHLTAIRARLRTAANGALGNEIFKIVICSRFGNTKSMLINALLRPSCAQTACRETGPLRTDLAAGSARLTQVRYSDVPYVRVWRSDNANEEWDYPRYLRESEWGDIEMVELGYPAELLHSGLILIDSPGTSESSQRDEMTLKAISDASAAILVYRSDLFASTAEQEFAAEVKKLRRKTFLIVNRMNGQVLDSNFWSMVALKLGHDPQKLINDPGSFDVYEVDAAGAFNAALASDSGAMEWSGITR